MKKNILLILSFVFVLTLQLGAQDIPKWKKMHYLSEEEMYLPNNNAKNFVRTDPPVHPVRMVAEFEQMQSVLVRYPFGVPVSLMVEMSQDCGVTTIVANSGQQAQVTSIYQNAGANMDNIDFLIAPTNSHWTRDYGPWFVIDGNDEFGVCDFPYNRPRPDDDEIPVFVADMLDINLFGMNIEQTGGNWMCSGISQAAQTDLVWEENWPDLTQQQIADTVQEYLGITNFHVLPDPLGDYIKHIDCWGKFLGPSKVLIGEVPVNDPQGRYEDFEYVADYFANTISDWGVPYEVYRVFTPGLSQVTPYTNSLILNNKVFVPLTGSQYDADALMAYEQAMPGYEVHGILYGEWYNTDALHCRAKGIADIGMLKINHMPLLGEIQIQDDYTIMASIRNYNGQPLYTDSLLLYYQLDGGAFTAVQMDQLLGDNYSATIPYVEEGTLVGYYIHAADESGRSANHPFIGAPDPHEFTVWQMNPGLEVSPDTLTYLTPDQCVEGQQVRIYPEDDEVVIDYINQEGEEIFWYSEPVVNFPYTLEAGDSLILTVYVGLVTDGRGELMQDTMFIECSGGDHDVLIRVDEDLLTGIAEEPGSIRIEGVFPNPFANTCTITLDLDRSQVVSIDVLDVKGSHVSGIRNGILHAGEQHVQWDASGHPAGIYYIRVIGDGFSEVTRVLKR